MENEDLVTVELDRGEAGIIVNVLNLPQVRSFILGHTYGSDALDTLVTAIQTALDK